MKTTRNFWKIDGSDAARIALVDPGLGEMTYAQLATDIASFRVMLSNRARLIGAEKLLIAIEMSSRSPVITAYLAALGAGHVVLVCAPDSANTVNATFDIYQPNLLIRQNGDLCEVTPASDVAIDLHPDLALLLSTSGSTGAPKLVRLSAENLASNAAAIAQYLRLSSTDRAVTTLPLHYIFGLSVLHSHLQAGAATVLTDLSVIDADFGRFFTAAGGTSISVVPHQVDLLLADGFRADSLPGLRHIAQAGGKLAAPKVRTMAALARQGGWEFFVMYGQTEASPRMAYLPPEAAEMHPDSVGTAIDGGHFTIRGEDGLPITATGAAGELIYSGPNVMMGYAQTQADLAKPKDTFALATGDVAELSEAGFIKIVGRSARFAKLFGLRISLDQVEAMLQDADIAAYAHAVDDQLVLLLPDANASAAARALVTSALKLPVNSIKAAHLAEVPTLPSGKADLKQLQRLAQQAVDDSKSDQGRPATLRKTMADATRRATIGPNDSYVRLGGDSLGYLQVQIYLEKTLGTAPANWENMTIMQLEAVAPDRATLNQFWARVDIDILLRVAAIICVILVHLARVPVGGGTWLLLLIMGYSFVRFQQPPLLHRQFKDVLLRMLHPILLLYAVLLCLYQIFQNDVPWRYAALMGNFIVPGRGSFLSVFWFVSLYAQLVLVLVGLYLVRPFQQAIRRKTWHMSALLFVVTTTIALGLLWWSTDPFPNDRYPGIFGGPVASRSLAICFPIVALGMMMYSAVGWPQKALTLFALGVTCLNFPATAPSQPIFLGGGGVLLLSRLTVPLPRPMARLVTTMAASTLFVYLLHNIVVHYVRTDTDTIQTIGLPAAALLTVALSFGLAHYAKNWFEAFDRFVARKWNDQKSPRVNFG